MAAEILSVGAVGSYASQVDGERLGTYQEPPAVLTALRV